MNELYDSVDYNNLNFEYVGPTKDVSFYEYMDSKELFNAIENSQIKVSETKNKQNEFLNKLSTIEISKKTPEQKEVIKILKNFTILMKQLLIFLETMLKCYRMQITMLNKMRLREKDLLTPKQMIQRLSIALAKLKAGNNSENSLNEIRQIIYSLYQSKEVTKKVYNNLMKSL